MLRARHVRSPGERYARSGRQLERGAREPIPVYFARHQDLSAAIGDSPVRLVLDKQPSNNLKQKLRLKTFSFRLDGTKAKTPTIGLFGFYDSFSLVPGLSTGRGNSTLSGVAALLHLAAKLRFLFEQNEQPE